MLKKIFLIFICIIFVSCNIQASSYNIILNENNVEFPEQLKQIYAQSALLMDSDSGRVLFEKNGYDKRPMASTTKIMTLIVTLENADLNDIVTISSNAARQPDVQLNICEGEQYYLKDLVYSLMLESHNDTAVAIAEHVGGSVEGFAKLMNKKAKELGCVNTNFVTPNGLDADGHETTAYELALIASYAIKNENFIKITNTQSHSFSDIEGKRSFSVNNRDQFLYQMEGAIGIKTGFTNKAGYCFVGALKRDNKTFISVVLACGWPPNKTWKWSDTQKLMKYGIENFNKRQIFEQKQFEPIYVKNGQNQFVNLFMKNETIELLMKEDDNVEIIYDIPQQLTAPVEKGTAVGSANYYINGELYNKFFIYTTESVKEIDYRFCLDRIIDMWFVK